MFFVYRNSNPFRLRLVVIAGVYSDSVSVVIIPFRKLNFISYYKYICFSHFIEEAEIRQEIRLMCCHNPHNPFRSIHPVVP